MIKDGNGKEGKEPCPGLGFGKPHVIGFVIAASTITATSYIKDKGKGIKDETDLPPP